MDEPTHWGQIEAEAEALLADEPDPIARMATLAAVLKTHLAEASFVGFYRVTSPGVLTVGPYQGPLACIRIPFERGVCGAAAREERPQLVPDVHLFPGHIACDAAARSELVVPILRASGALVGVLDLDSHEPGAFTTEDQRALERLVTRFFA